VGIQTGRWYFAEIVLRYEFQGESDILVHVNSILISSSSDDEAYEKSLQLGSLQEREFTNTDGMLVRVSFAGLRNLFYIRDTLEDGCELLYEEITDLTADEVNALSRPKEQLAVFSAGISKSDD
jgi:hypothetical protein